MFQAIPFNKEAIILGFLSSGSTDNRQVPCRNVRSLCLLALCTEEFIGFFYGAALEGDCGDIMVIKCIGGISFQCFMNVGIKPLGELLALWGLLHFAELQGIDLWRICGDSWLIIEWANNRWSFPSIIGFGGCVLYWWANLLFL